MFKFIRDHGFLASVHLVLSKDRDQTHFGLTIGKTSSWKRELYELLMSDIDRNARVIILFDKSGFCNSEQSFLIDFCVC